MVWGIDSRVTEINDAYDVKVNLSAQGQVNEQLIHLAKVEGGTMRWFTDCGEPNKYRSVLLFQGFSPKGDMKEKEPSNRYNPCLDPDGFINIHSGLFGVHT